MVARLEAVGTRASCLLVQLFIVYFASSVRLFGAQISPSPDSLLWVLVLYTAWCLSQFVSFSLMIQRLVRDSQRTGAQLFIVIIDATRNVTACYYDVLYASVKSLRMRRSTSSARVKYHMF